VNFVSAAALVSRIARQIGDPWRRRYMLVILLTRHAYPLGAAVCVLMGGALMRSALSA